MSVNKPDNLVLTENHALAGHPGSDVTLSAASGGDGTYPYSITPDLPDSLEFNATTRVITGTADNTQMATTYTYTADDGSGGTNSSDSETFTITVNAAPSVDAPSDQTYTAGTAITAFTLDEATGGIGTITYELSSNLPTGLEFKKSSRELSGTPAAATTNAVTVTYTARDANNAEATDTFDITVNAAVSATAPSDQAYTQNWAITSITLDEATGEDGNSTYEVTPALPPGLEFNPTSRVLSGTPNLISGQTTDTYKATDGNGVSDTATFQITVNVPPSVSAPSDQTYTAGTAISALDFNAATGGMRPYT